MSDSGSELRTNNEQIVKLITLLKEQRDEMNFLITKQQAEKEQIENDLEKLSFKLQLLTKSLGQRLQAKINYDRTITEIEDNYSNLVQDSGKLLFMINKEVHQLEEIMDKKIGTGTSTETEVVEEHHSNNSVGSAKQTTQQVPTSYHRSSTDSTKENGSDADMVHPPPIKKHFESDLEIQSYREAYGKQHRQSSPISSRAGSISQSRRKDS